MHKQAASAQGETALSVEASSGKRPKLTGPNEKAQKSSVVINVDSPDRAFDAQLALEGAPKDAPIEAYEPPEDGTLAKGSPRTEGVVMEDTLEVVVAPSFLTRLANTGPHKPRMSDQRVLSSYIPP